MTNRDADAYADGSDRAFAALQDLLPKRALSKAMHRLARSTNPVVRRTFIGTILRAYPTHYPSHIIEQAAIAGALMPGRVDQDAQGVADAIAARLDLIAEEYERGWTGQPTQDGGIRLSRLLRGRW